MRWNNVWLYLQAFHILKLFWFAIPKCHSQRMIPSALTVEPPPMFNDNIDPNCYNFTHANWHEMEFYSPGYPNRYPNKVDCVMYLQAPAGFFIELVFMEKFSVEESEDCTYDYIELRDGPFGYSKFIARFCGDGFPVSIQTTTRYLWARFKTDDMVQYDGFKAVYEYKINENSGPEDAEPVCRIYMDNMAADGELNSRVFPLADTSQRNYPIEEPVDCTWEMVVEKDQRIRLHEMKLHMTKPGRCLQNVMEIYDGTSSETDKYGVYCDSHVSDYSSLKNRLYVRLRGSRLSEKPVFSGRYTVFKPASATGKCEGRLFFCDDMCLSQALVCNGQWNCPSGADERGCGASSAGSSDGDDDGEPVSMMVIILAAVGGLIFTILVIGVCVTCRYNRAQKLKNKLQKQENQKRNALEMAVSNSNNTTYQLAKQNSQSSYYSLPRPSGQATLMQHRSSFSSKPSSEPDYGDHMSDTSTYKKFLQLEQSLDDESSRCPSPYGPSGPVFTTIVEHHPGPTGMTPDLGWGYQGPTDPPTSPTLAENLSKLRQYTSGNPKTFQDSEGNVGTGMTMDFRYDPSVPVYPATKFRIKSPDIKSGWNPDSKFGSGKSLTFKNQDADVGPDLTREIETS